MQIHELNNYTGELGSSAFVAVDNGNDTGKVSAATLVAGVESDLSELDTSLNNRIDNIIAGGTAPSAAEVTDARYGADGVTYASLGQAIRTQINYLSDASYDTTALAGRKAESSFSVASGDSHSSDNDTVAVYIPSGSSFTVVTNLSPTVSMGVQYFAFYADGTKVSLGSKTAGLALPLIATNDIVRIGAYLSAVSSDTAATLIVSVEGEYTKQAVFENAFNNLFNGMRTFKGMGNFDHYGFDTSGAFITSQKYRVSNNDRIVLDYDITISVADGFRWGFLYFASADAATGTYRGWYTGTNTIPKGTYFQIQIGRVNENTGEIANVEEFLNAVTFNTSERTSENTIGMYSPITFQASDFVNGTWESNGMIGNISTRICTNRLFPVFKGNVFAYLPPTGFDISFGYYSPTDKTLLFWSDWLSGITEQKLYKIPENGRFFIQYRRSNNAALTPSDFGGTAVLNNGIIDSLTTLWSDAIVSGLGANKYVGEKIPSRVYSFNHRNIFTMSYNNQTSQDIDIFGDYMFVAFSETEQIKVYSLLDYSLLAAMNVETIHGSSIQFSDEYYDANDDYPLLYSGGWSDNRINVIRITESNGTWTANVIRTIYIPTAYGYYASPNIDKDNNILYTYAHSNASIPNTDQMIISSWDLNNLTDNGDGTYTPQLLDYCNSPSVGTYQGHKYYGGRIYLTSAKSSAPFNQKVFAIDCGSGEIVTTIDMSNILTTETEGLCYRINGDDIEWYLSEIYKVYKLDF